MVVVKTARGLTTRVRFLPLILTSLGSKSGTPFYLNHRNHVNTILRFCESSSERRGFGEDAETCTRGRVRSPETSATRNGLRLVFNRYRRRRLQPMTGHRSQKTLGSAKSYGLGRGVGRGLGDGPDLGVGVGRGVAVGDAVAVARLAVGPSRTLGYVPLARCRTQRLCLTKISSRPQPKTLFGGPGITALGRSNMNCAV